MKRVRNVPTFSTPHLLDLTGLTRRQLQRLEDAGAVRPLVRGSSGRGHAATWSVVQAVGVAYAKAFLDAGCLATWAWAACRWVARQDPGRLGAELHARGGRFLLALTPDGHEGRLIEPYLEPETATRERRLMVAALDLKPVYSRVIERAADLAERFAKEEKEAEERTQRG